MVESMLVDGRVKGALPRPLLNIHCKLHGTLHEGLIHQEKLSVLLLAELFRVHSELGFF